MAASLPHLIVHQRFTQRLHPMPKQRLLLILHRQIHTKLTMLNLTVPLNEALLTIKLNHWVYPPEFMSFCRIRSYYYSPVFILGEVPWIRIEGCRFRNLSWIKGHLLTFGPRNSNFRSYFYLRSCLRSIWDCSCNWFDWATYQIS
mgnify:CR=1 FL=1